MKKLLHNKTLRRSFLALLCGFFLLQVAQAQCPPTAWVSQTSAVDNAWYSVTYGNGLFVAVADTGTGNRVMTSPDGITWTSRTSAADNSWLSVTYGNGLFVAVATDGAGNNVMTSPDGITWTIRTSAIGNIWTSVTYGNGLFVAVSFTGTGNRVMTSPDGITWTSRTSAADNQWRYVTYGNGLFVAVAASGTGNRVMTSPDGITWTSRTSAADNNWLSVTYGNGVFVAVANSGNGNRVMTSPDGITWTSRTSAADNQWTSVTYGNGVFVAVSYNGTNNRVMTSPNGITWTSRTSAADNQWRSVTYGNGVFVAVSDSGTGNRVMTSSLPLVTPSVTIAANPGNSITTGTSVTFTATLTNGGTTPAYQWKKNNNNVGSNSVTYTDAYLENGDIITCVLTSNNPCASTATATSSEITMAVSYPCPAGITWASRTSAADNQWTSVTYGNGLFVAVAGTGTGNRIMTSPDGITWTSRTPAADNFWQSVTYGNGLFVAVSFTGTNNRVMTSPDGITWTSRTSAADNFWYSVTYGNGLFVAVAYSGTGNRVMTSPDGINWTIRTSAANNSWHSVTYGNGLFVAVSNTGTGNRVMTSPDGITWTSRTSAANNSWNSVTYGNGLFVAVSYSGTGNRVMTSPDGITWTSRTSAADNYWLSVTYGNGLFVAVASVSTDIGDRVMTSPDGITWTSRTSAADNYWRSVTYGNGVFVAVSDSGTGNRVMTSSPPLVTPSIAIAANPGNSITTGTSVTFTATPTNGGTTPAYQWKKNNNNVGSNSVTYTDAALENGDIITCLLTSNNPCASTATATSSEITMAVISTDANLSALTTTAGTISPTFVSATTAYTASVSNSTTSITVTPTMTDANASITVNGTAVTNGTASGSVALTVGSNTITTIVTAQDGTTIKTYTVTVTRAKANQTITFPAFASKTTTSPDFEPGATTDSGLALTYASSNPLVATVAQDMADGNKWKIHIVGEGTTDITTNQAGNANYNSSSALQELVVGTVLPVSLTDYQAKIQNNNAVLLNWTTVSEADNAGFEILKSTDGKSFEKLTFVKGAGNSNTKNTYSYIDLSPSNGVNYYQLIQVDNDGTKSDKGVKSVNFSFGESNQISVYPNPTADIVIVTFEAGIYQSLNILDLSGKVLINKNIKVIETKATVSLSAFPDAVYILQLTGKNGSISKQIVKR